MAKAKYIGAIGGRGKEFLKLFNQLTYSRSAWQVWEDLMTVMACSICNAVDRRKEPYEKRERRYERSIKSLGGVDVPAQMLGIVTMALEENPKQDFLGQLYMSLNLGSHWHGQFFTPYHVSELMAKITIGEDCKGQIKEKGYISVCDPCVGAGAMLIAVANAMKEAGINYQRHAVFVGQDIDSVVAKMAYIQLSLLGCPGYIIVGNSLTNPSTGHVLFPEENEGKEIWITPMFMHQAWEMRRTGILMQKLFCETAATKKAEEEERFFMFFNFDQEEEPMEMDSIKSGGRLEPGQAKCQIKSQIEETGEADLKRSGGVYEKCVDCEKAADSERRSPDPEKKEAAQEPGATLEGKCEGGEKNPEDRAEKAKGQTKAYTSGSEKIRAEAEAECRAAKDEESRAITKVKMDKVVKYISGKCEADPKYNALVIQEHKTWERCDRFMQEKAEKMMVAGRPGVMVDDSVAYQWMDEYYQADDLEEAKAAEEKQKKEKAEKAAQAKKAPARTTPAPEKKESKPKKNNGDIEGQLDMFSMMGM